ncbi:MAG: outer-membrane lipoprotein carrier protein LolA [Bacteroidales bacterium]|nr:outer-membrane lipoprotein carrier protein LolA [Bacteroidales bacterium]
MKRILNIILMMAMALGAIAQNSDNRVVNLLSNAENIYMQFICTVNGSNVIPDGTELNGRIYVANDSYRFEIQDIIIFNDGKEYSTYNKSVNEVIVFNAADDEMNIASILNTVKTATITKTLEKNSIATYSFAPKNSETIKNLTIDFNTQTNAITHLYAETSDGVKYSVAINDFVVNQKLPDNFFTFKPALYPDVMVIDMR